MGWLISLLGVALALAGAMSLANGISYLRMDWGATEVMAGTVALAGGCVTFALGAVLFALRSLSRPVPSGVVARPNDEASGDEAGAADRAPPAVSGRLKAGLATMRRPPTIAPTLGREPPPPDVSRDRPDGTSGQPFPSRPSLAQTDPASPAPIVEPQALPSPEPSRHEAPVADAPTVVGRYEANGASYVLFSDGTIEVETETGTHRFGSMADLKDHIERQDAG